ncbi:MAG: UTP--glucose-1-phosphate uridylyltransferase [Anaerolineales bacterium]
MDIDRKFYNFEKKMRAEKLPNIAIQNFKYYYTQLIEGHTGLIHKSEVRPIESIANVETLSEKITQIGQAALPNIVTIKLNGGLGTSMGLDSAKSLIEVRKNLSLLDIVARQAMRLQIPLVLMNSFGTRGDSLVLLKKYPNLHHNKIALDFMQHKIPKIRRSDLSPAVWEKDPDLEWCPPGHGDVYAALISSGMLDQLINSDIKYMLISNSDNLGGIVDTTILGYLVETNAPVLMEVADRTEMDKKGGFPVYRQDGSLLLWETAQCSPEEIDAYQDVHYFKYFNANNIWINVSNLKNEMQKNENNLRLPMIRNEKTIDVKDKSSTPVYCLETAMGSVISIFKGAQLIKVPRSRFCPIKMTNELLAVRSDAYVLTSDFRLILNPKREYSPPVINLDSRHYKFLVDFEARFPEEIPSLLNCKKLNIEGDVKFGKNVVLKGDVQLVNSTNDQVVLENVVVADEEWRV